MAKGDEGAIYGSTKQEGNMWGAEIILTTPYGQTKLESGFIYSSDAEASEALRFKIDEVLEVLKDDITITSKTEGRSH
jgi:hypothetical protein